MLYVIIGIICFFLGYVIAMGLAAWKFSQASKKGIFEFYNYKYKIERIVEQ